MSDFSGFIRQLIQQRDRLNGAIAALEDVSNGVSRKGTRRISAAGRAKIAAAQRKRWAKFRAKKKSV